VSEAVGVGTISRLEGLRTAGSPVLTAYLDLDHESLQTLAARDVQLRLLCDGSTLRPAEADIDRVRERLRSQPTFAHSVRGLAIFSCEPTGILEVVPLLTAIEPMVVLDTIPWVEPLLDMTTSGNWGVAVIDSESARLFRGGPGSLGEFSVTNDGGGRPDAARTLHPARWRASERPAAAHLRRVAERLARAHLRRAFSQLVIVAPAKLHLPLQASLAEPLKQVLTGFIDAELTHAASLEIIRVIAPLAEGAERARERALLTRLDHVLAAGERAAAGPGTVFTLLGRRRVETLLVAAGASFTAGLCPRCGSLSTTRASCEVDGASLESVDGIEHAVRLAEDQAAEVVIIRHEVAALAEHGSIAALTRAPTAPSVRALTSPAVARQRTSERRVALEAGACR
jgi:protein required for attachment to host cells